MPYVSEAQRRKFHSDPKLQKYTAEYDAATPRNAKLPERVKPKPEAQHGHQHLTPHAKKHLGNAGHPSYQK